MKTYELIEKLQKIIDNNNGLEYCENKIIDGDIYYEGRILDLKAMDENELLEEIKELKNASGYNPIQRIRNFTPHPINIEGQEQIPSEGIIRCKEITKKVGEYAGVDLIEKEFGELEGLPESEEGTIFVISIIAATAAKKLGRNDCVVPGEVIRDEEGKIIGCKNLAII